MRGVRLRPDLPGKVHGIVSLDPPTVQCDGCGYTFSHARISYAVLLSGITFRHRHPGVRKCRDCWEAVERA